MAYIFSLKKWLQQLSVSRKFYIIITCIVCILVFELGSFWFAMMTMSDIRAYVGGEGLWSKAQKESVNYLVKYSSSFDEADYANSLEMLKVPLGDKAARLELEKKDPDLSVARQGFLDGGNHPDDVNGLIFLFQKFRHVSYMDHAIQIWTGGDSGIQQQEAIGERIHSVIVESSLMNRSKTETLAILQPLVEEAVRNDRQVTLLENQFSATLGEASRAIGMLLLLIVSFLTVFLGFIALLLAAYIAKVVTQVDTAKTEFVSLASHQLRTPLTTVAWGVEQLHKEMGKDLDPEKRKQLEQIQQNNRRMITLVNSLLNVSKIELGVFAIQPVPTNIRAMIQDILEDLQSEIVLKKIQVKENYENEKELVAVDRDLFRIVLQNIIGNALNYTPSGGTVTLSVSEKKKGDFVDRKRITEDSILISVADTGCGIPLSEQKHIFSKLFRAGNAQAKQTDGTGLGLYITKAIVDNSGGAIWFVSALNKGTSFHVSLPISGMRSQMHANKLVLCRH